MMYYISSPMRHKWTESQFSIVAPEGHGHKRDEEKKKEKKKEKERKLSDSLYMKFELRLQTRVSQNRKRQRTRLILSRAGVVISRLNPDEDLLEKTL
jgi:hypothetical protein